MSLKTKLVRVLESLLDEANNSIALANSTKKTTASKYFEIQSGQNIDLLKNLGARITILSDKIQQLNENVIHLTTLHEETLYMLDQVQQTEDNRPAISIDSEEKKFQLN